MIQRRARTAGLCSVCAALLLLGGCAAFNNTFEQLVNRVDRYLHEGAAPTTTDGETAQALYDRGVEQRASGRYKAAAASFLAAADAGHAGAAFDLGKAYYAGQGVPLDLEKAAGWFNIAADRGDARAQYLLGTTYYAGAGVERDPDLAIAYLGAAADQGYARAQYLLGEAAMRGVGGPVDPAWAARWYGKAAAQGHAAAQYAYGAAYAAGRGVPRDPKMAYEWLSIASKSGNAEALALRADVGRKLDRARREEARQRAAAYRPARADDFADTPTVVYVQGRLSALGYDAGPADGVAGPRTRAAITTFQSETGLVADGRISPELVKRLRAARPGAT